MTTLQDDKRLYMDMDGGVGDNLTATSYGECGEIHLRIEEPWAGDTESGFGAVCGVTLSRAQALALADWIRVQSSGDKE